MQFEPKYEIRSETELIKAKFLEKYKSKVHTNVPTCVTPKSLQQIFHQVTWPRVVLHAHDHNRVTPKFCILEFLKTYTGKVWTHVFVRVLT